MKLSELLAANPEARAEYDAQIQAADKAAYDANKAANDQTLQRFDSIMVTVEGQGLIKKLRDSLADFRNFNDDVMALAAKGRRA